MVMEEKLLDVGMFVVAVEPELEQFGIKLGDILFIVGDGMLPMKSDPYNYRKLFLAMPVINDHVDVSHDPYAVDAKAVVIVSDEEQKRLDGIKDQDFGSKEEQAQPGSVGTA